MKHLFVRGALFFGLIFIAGCQKNQETTDMSCQLQTNTTVFEESSLDVTYKLEASGDYTISSFYYYDETGKVVLQNPAVPFEITVSLAAQKTVEAGAAGSVKNGSIEASYKATGDSAVYIGLDQCEQQSTN